MHKTGFMLLALVLALTGFAPPQQTNAPLISLAVTAGYDGLFRANEWFPLFVEVSNDGGDVNGRLVVRPERAGNAFTNTFSTPVEMPAGSRKTVFLYVTARNFATDVQVEFIDADGVALQIASAPLRSILFEDQLHVVLTQSSAGSVDLTTVGTGGYAAFQANWTLENLPDRAAALTAIDTLVFSDIDTGPLSPGQQQAVRDWLAAGGHLIVTGGANWQATAAGLVELLPLIPTSSATVPDLDALTTLSGNVSGTLPGDTVIATGAPLDVNDVLIAHDDGTPLLVRHDFGLGTVDYLTTDPLAQPLRDWENISDLWFTLGATIHPRPSWSQGFVDFDRAASATEILPGLNLLPDVLPLCGFLAFYVMLIGPLNYVILNRFNRREWAWVSIPVFIIIFSGLAWLVGFNLRGNTATLSRLAIVQSWPESDQAQVDGLVGLLSPRRSNYTLTMNDGSVLRPFSRSAQSNPFAANIQAGTDIQQAESFSATNFTVDASFIATFNTTTIIERPDISGQVSLLYVPPEFDDEPGHWSVRGSVRNDSAETLHDPVILARGVSLELEQDLEPGVVQPFELALDADTIQPAAPSALERTSGQIALRRSSFNRFGSRDVGSSEATISDIIGEGNYNSRLFFSAPGDTATEQETFRRQMFLSAMMEDQFFSTARGNNVYLAGWSDTMPLATELEGALWEPLDTTLHLVKLNVEFTPPAIPVHIRADQFTWVALERTGLTSDIAPVNAVMQSGDAAAFRFTPLPDAVLATVDELHIELNLSTNSRFEIPIEVWDWQRSEWQVVDLQQDENRTSVRRATLRNPDRFLGPQNTVQVRVSVDETSGFLRIARLAIEQQGEF